MTDSAQESFDNPSWLEPVIIVLLIINYLILLPSSFRFMKSTWSVRHESYIHARRPKIQILYAISLLIIIIIHPILLYLYFWPWNIENNIDEILNKCIHIMVIVLSIIPLIGVAIRIWLFYYNHKFSEACFKQKRVELQNDKKEELIKNGGTKQRQSVSPFVTTTPKPNQGININDQSLTPIPNRIESQSPKSSVTTPSILSMPTINIGSDELIKMDSIVINPMQFWIDNRKSWGSARFLRWIVLTTFIIDIIIISICSFVVDGIWLSYTIQTAIYLILLGFITFYFSKISPFRDEFFVRRQLFGEVIVIYTNFILWVITLIVWYLTKNDDVKEKEFNIYNNNNNQTIRIVIRFLLDGNMTITCFALIIAQFAIPWFKYTNNIDRLSNRNVLSKSKDRKKRLKITLFECITHRDGYYLFMEYLMKEFSVENLLFITEVAFMKNKFEKTVLIPRNKSHSNSVAASIKNAFSHLTDRNLSQESSASHNNGFSVPSKIIKPHHTVVSSVSGSNTTTTSITTAPLQTVSLASNQSPNSPQSKSRKSAGNRLSKLRDIPSDGAIITTQSEVENIMNKSALQIATEMEEQESKYNGIMDNESDNGQDSDTDQSDTIDHSDQKMMELGIINGKKLTIQASAFTNSNNSTTTTVNIIDVKQKDGKVKLPKLPHTVTMTASMKQNNLFDAVDMIYDNFIDKNATFQINVSSQCRGQITKIVIQHRLSVEAQREKLKAMGNDIGGIIPSGLSGIIVDVHIFDEASNEILALLRSSFYRFAQTKAYKVYCEAMRKL